MEGLARYMICFVRLIRIYMRYDKIDLLISEICWYLYEAWYDISLVDYDLLLSISGIIISTVFYL